MNLKEELLKRIENEVTYEDGFGSKTIKEVIDEVFKEAENKQFVITDVGCSETELVCEHDWQTVFYQETKIIGRYCPECDEFEAY